MKLKEDLETFKPFQSMYSVNKQWIN